MLLQFLFVCAPRYTLLWIGVPHINDKTMKIANNLTFSVRDFRAVHSADINLNGITVVAGVNGSGKSTLSKLIYNSVENILHFDEVVRKEIHEEIMVIYRLFQRVHNRLVEYIPDSMNDQYRKSLYWSILYSLETKEDAEGLKKCLSYLDYLHEVMTYEDAQKPQRINRLASVLHFIEKEDFTVDKALDVLRSRVSQGQNSIDNFNRAMEMRSSESFYANLKEEFKDLSPNNLSITELDSLVLSADEVKVGKLPTLSKAIYLDSPMIVGLDFTDFYKKDNYWETFNDLLNKEGSPIDGAADINELLKETIQGESEKKEESIISRGFSYKRSDGQRFDLEESATGVRAFSAIQILLNNGVIDEDTLLIIDEPEAHLHPQWIVEYARLIVRMNTQLGVKFFITSHSTDMISALKYINNKEGIKSSLTFYNAEPLQEDPFKFDYRNLERDIEPIFESFNKSFDKIEQYGTDED